MDNAPFKKVAERDLVFVDTETTGLELNKELLEIGLVRAKAGTFEFVDEYDIKIKPARIGEANKESLEVVGYDEAEWEREGVDLKTGLERFLSYTQDAVLVGHNLPFDWAHILKSLEECGLEPNYLYKGFDTFPMSWLLLHDKEEFVKFSLDELSRYFGVEQGRKHRAIDDARTTYKVFLKLVEEAGKRK